MYVCVCVYVSYTHCDWSVTMLNSISGYANTVVMSQCISQS